MNTERLYKLCQEGSGQSFWQRNKNSLSLQTFSPKDLQVEVSCCPRKWGFGGAKVEFGTRPGEDDGGQKRASRMRRP